MAPSKETPDNAVQVPSSSTFSFKAPFPPSSSNFAVPSPIKQRRVSHVLPNSPRVVQAWNFRDDTDLGSHVPETESTTPAKKGKMRKLTNGAESEPFTERKARKKWSDEETQMLVQGCNRHGVGNWKTILSDPTLQFDNRSPVDLKDRHHYPNARTHLSSKVRSTLPDGTSLFEKTRSKKRRPFTEEEDRALKAGYEIHGTVWATIVKDPVFREQGRRSTDLRDRFRNAFPELYQAAGYKPRNPSKKRHIEDERMLPVRAATDDQLSMSTTGPVRSRRRAHTSQSLFRGGTKSVPQSATPSDDEESSGGEDDGDSVFKAPPVPVFVDNISTSSSSPSKKLLQFPQESSFSSTDDDDIDMVTFEQLSSVNIPDFMPASGTPHSRYPNDAENQSQTWSGDNEAHATPPGTPHIQRSRGTGAGVRRASESTYGGSHGLHNGRSISVPPSEARAQLTQPLPHPQTPLLLQQTISPQPPPRTPLLQQALSPQPPARPPSHLQQALSPALSSHPSTSSTPMTPPPPPPPPSAAYVLPSLTSATYAWRAMSPEEMNSLNLPFLDLHYHGIGADTDAGNLEAQMQVRQGLALDLAQASVGGVKPSPMGLRQPTLASHGINTAAGPGPNVSVAPIPSVLGKGGGGGGGGVLPGAPSVGSSGLSRSHSHHRGQSAVCPQDLMLRNDNNKRKRASWDGAHA
ncbi:hypothetical protein H0H93_016565 [Arthromyces matolae]|nr:hypothetical protein H0H93_016565 [Arthromyces matolae]